MSDTGIARFLARATGSAVAPDYAADYAKLFRAHGHVAGALGMMASWDLAALERDLPGLGVPLALIAAEHDAAVPPSVAARVAGLVPGSHVYALASRGHLAHEEAPQDVADLVMRLAEGTPCAQQS